MASSQKEKAYLGPLPTPPSTSHSASTTYSRPTFDSSHTDSYHRDTDKDDAALRTPTQTPPTSLSPILSPEPDPQSKPTFEPPSSSSSEFLPSHSSPRSDPLGSPFNDDQPRRNRVSLSTRLEFLSRLALNEERVLPDESLDILHRHIDRLQHGMVEPTDLDTSVVYAAPGSDKKYARAESLGTLQIVEASQKELLAATERIGNQLRDRQEEAKHVHEILTAKLEALAQKCILLRSSLNSTTSQLRGVTQIAQEKDGEIDNLVIENNALEVEIQRLRDEGADQELIIRAMGAAVGGLEGWLENLTKQQSYANDSTPLTPRRGGINAIPRSAAKLTPRPGKRQREVIGGKGRFRGRYIIEEDDPSSPLSQHSSHFDGQTEDSDQIASPSKENSRETEMMEGLRAWIKGFRDVEEGLKRRSPANARYSPMAHQRRDSIFTEGTEYG